MGFAAKPESVCVEDIVTQHTRGDLSRRLDFVYKILAEHLGTLVADEGLWNVFVEQDLLHARLTDGAESALRAALDDALSNAIGSDESG
jgi:hypothetical protein